MKLIVGLSAVVLLSGGFFAYTSIVSANAAEPGLVSIANARNGATDPERLEFRNLVDFSGEQPRFHDRVLSLSGKRVRVTGYVAHLEPAPRDGFFLAPIPVHGDESGAGSGDLPPESIFVVTLGDVRSFSEPIESRVEVVGVLEVGLRADEHGSTHWLRIIPD